MRNIIKQAALEARGEEHMNKKTGINDMSENTKEVIEKKTLYENWLNTKVQEK